MTIAVYRYSATSLTNDVIDVTYLSPNPLVLKQSWYSNNICQIKDPRTRATLGRLYFPSSFGASVEKFGLPGLRFEFNTTDLLGESTRVTPVLQHTDAHSSRFGTGYFSITTNSSSLSDIQFSYKGRSEGFSEYKVHSMTSQGWTTAATAMFSRDGQAFVLNIEAWIAPDEVAFMYLSAIAILKSGAYKDEINAGQRRGI
ncbi:hypothetical protein CPB84DRAFT_1936430 [Gymnopilus junonius]|uniref:Uncharacterized protein n=1 Tax=Gymnopilus junonius TaxID=109634 RepID=A0A9P5TKF4_GYMJU|nr:hypothetical protein CPB84DRAFT_1936430 [Gymnopilus junonius]